MPAISARLIIREERAQSRVTAIVAPLGWVAAKAAPRRAQYSGVSSTLTRPVRPAEEKSPGRHSPAQMIDSLTRDPVWISLFGQSLTPASMWLPSPITQSSPTTVFSSRRQLFLMVTLRPMMLWRSRQLSPT